MDVGLLDRLMNLVGELVLARNQVLQLTAGQRDPTLLGTCQRLNLITTELQEGVMKTRMQPIRTIWSKFPRLVRDLARACGKEVRLDLDGQETELDRSILEAIKDPLTHLVRNAIDHGIEAAAVRRQRGKPAEGRLCLRAFHEGGQGLCNERFFLRPVSLQIARFPFRDSGCVADRRVSLQAILSLPSTKKPRLVSRGFAF